MVSTQLILLGDDNFGFSSFSSSKSVTENVFAEPVCGKRGKWISALEWQGKGETFRSLLLVVCQSLLLGFPHLLPDFFVGQCFLAALGLLWFHTS